MKFLYITNNAFALSETFKRDTVDGIRLLDIKIDILADRIVDYGRKMENVYECKFLSNLRWIRGVLKIAEGKVSAKTSFFSRMHSRLSSSVISNHISYKSYQGAYIDYGTVACEILEAIRRKDIPIIVHFHGYDITSALVNPWYRQKLHELYDYASCLIAASEHIRRLLILNGAPPSKIVVIRYGLNEQTLSLVPWREKAQNPTAFFLGRMTAKKHPIALLEAFRIVVERIPDARLIIVGDGPLMTDVVARLNKLGLEDSVILHGALPQEEALAMLRSAWIYAQHSVTSLSGDQEGFGISLAEAAAMGIPVVSTIHNGIVEQVADGITGYLVPEFNFEAMAEKMISLLNDPDLIQEMGAIARERILNMCDPKKRYRTIAEILIDIAVKRTYL